MAQWDEQAITLAAAAATVRTQASAAARASAEVLSEQYSWMCSSRFSTTRFDSFDGFHADGIDYLDPLKNLSLNITLCMQ